MHMHMHMHMSHAHVQADVPRRHHVHFFMALALQDPDNFVPMMFRAQIVKCTSRTDTSRGRRVASSEPFAFRCPRQRVRSMWFWGKGLRCWPYI
jgi:hypothetical protein